MNAKARHRRRARAARALRSAERARVAYAADLWARMSCRAEGAYLEGRPQWSLRRGVLLVAYRGVKRGALETVAIYGSVRV